LTENLQAENIARDLCGLTASEVHGEISERAAYATDASPYEILPLCIVLPTSANDVAGVVRYAHEKGISVVPRGGGSGLVGGALGHGIVLDFTKHMNRIISIDDHSVTCEPGIYRANLEEAVNKRSGLSMPADPSSSAYCSIGGMIGTNASGAHSVKYGHTIDYLESVDLVLYDGTILDLSPVSLSSEEWRRIRNEGSSNQRSRIYNQLYDLLAPNRQYITDSMPKVSKNSAGYRLDMLFSSDGETFNPAKIVCSAEGTFESS
jgi:FAD/FMN-containing dehydrogenase